MSATVIDAELQGRVLWLKDQLAGIPSPYNSDLNALERAAWNRRHRTAVDRLNHDLLSLPVSPAGIRHAVGSVQMQMLGLKVSCTSGLVGACRNWITRAEAILVERNQGMPHAEQVQA